MVGEGDVRVPTECPLVEELFCAGHHNTLRTLLTLWLMCSDVSAHLS